MQSIRTALIWLPARGSTTARCRIVRKANGLAWSRLQCHETVTRYSTAISSSRVSIQLRCANAPQIQRSFSLTATRLSIPKVERFILHDIGEGIKEVVLKNWMVKVGDQVKEFDAICEVESDKATAEITSRFNGRITKIYYEPGDMAAIGQPLVDIELESDGSSDRGNSKSGSSGETGSISKQVEHPARRGVEMSEAASQQASQQRAATLNASSNVRTLPSVRRLAANHNVDLTQVIATGKHGRILKEDLLAHLEHNESSTIPNRPQDKKLASTSLPAQNVGQTHQSVTLTSIQRAMTKTMTKSLEIPHFNYADEIDLTDLMNMVKRQKQAAKVGSQGSQVASPFAYIVKLFSLALLEYPQLNASLDESKTNLIVKHQHNIGVAVDTRHGLVVPNIKNVQLLTISQINAELLRLRELAYESKLTTSDLSGGTASLSNIGAIGGTYGIPLIVSPEILIGALGQVRRLPRFVGADDRTQVEARQIMQVVWSADHRVVDGATLSRFTNLLKQFCEQPETALIRLK